MSEQELNVELSRLVDVVDAALMAAELFADKHQLSFSFSPAYGMGGGYNGEENSWTSSTELCS